MNHKERQRNIKERSPHHPLQSISCVIIIIIMSCEAHLGIDRKQKACGSDHHKSWIDKYGTVNMTQCMHSSTSGTQNRSPASLREQWEVDGKLQYQLEQLYAILCNKTCMVSNYSYTVLYICVWLVNKSTIRWNAPMQFRNWRYCMK